MSEETFEDAMEGQRHDPMTVRITFINKLQDVFAVTGYNSIDLPQIAVVGSQSSGKSSVLEAFVNKCFLPRGENIVTKCPIVLRLIHTPARKGGLKEWCVFKHCESRKWTDFQDVGKEILTQMRHLAGDNKGISPESITLTIYSPSVVTLTVVDLPGFVKLPQGDQPENIEDQVAELIKHYIKSPTTIILAVSAANDDLSNSESINIARKVDSTRERTLAVLTKLDKEDSHKKVRNILSNTAYPMRYGFVGVVNHSQLDLDNGVSMEEVRVKEEHLLKTRFPDLAAKNGTKFLAWRLSELLRMHILRQLPTLENKINASMKQNEEILISLGGDDIPNKSNTMTKIIFKFWHKFTSEFEGIRRNIPNDKPCMGSRIKVILEDYLGKELEVVNPLDQVSDQEIHITILNSGNFESRLIIVEAAYQDLVKKEIKRLLQPCKTCVDIVHEELQTAIQNCIDPDVESQFPKLSQQIIAIATQFLRERWKIVTSTLENHVAIEGSFIKTSREDFLNEMYDLLKKPDITKQNFAKKLVVKYGPAAWVEKVKGILQKNSNFEEFQNDNEQGTYSPQSEGVNDPKKGRNRKGKKNKNSWTPIDDLEDQGNSGLGSTFESFIDKASTAANIIVPGTPVAMVANVATAFTRNGENSEQNGPKEYRAHDNDNVNIVKRLIENYFEIVRQNLRDFVPKLVAHTMIFYTCDELLVCLNDELHKVDKIDDLIQVSAETRIKRDEAKRQLETLQQATRIIKETRENVVAHSEID